MVARGRRPRNNEKTPGGACGTWGMPITNKISLGEAPCDIQVTPTKRRAKPAGLLVTASTGAIRRRCTRTEAPSVKGARTPQIQPSKFNIPHSMRRGRVSGRAIIGRGERLGEVRSPCDSIRHRVSRRVAVQHQYDQ